MIKFQVFINKINMSESENSFDAKQEKRRLKDEIRSIKIGLRTVENILLRQRNIEDAALRYTIFVDKLCLIFDVGTAFLQEYFNDEKYPEDLKERIDDLSETLKDDLSQLMKWIQSPMYSPDHPHGIKVMQSSEKEFNSLQDKES